MHPHAAPRLRGDHLWHEDQGELARHGYNLSPGMLYPILHGLEEQGFLLKRSEVVVRKYHEATAKGREALAEAGEKNAELVEEVLDVERR